MDIDAEPANDEHPEANGEEVEAATSIQASEKQRALFRPVIIQSAAVLEAVKARPGKVEVCLYAGATADLDSFCARRRPKSTVGAEESLRRGRTKERAQARKQERKCLRSWRRLENEETGFSKCRLLPVLHLD